MTDSPAQLLYRWIGRRAPPTGMDWLDRARASIAVDPSPRALGLAISMSPRHVGKADLALSPADLADAERLRPGWAPGQWSVDQAARILLLLSAMTDGAGFAARARAMVATADLGEVIALYRGLPLYPNAADFVELAVEGLRTAMRSVFEAVAHHNPYPAENFSDSAWNHMILKALFIETTLDPIHGLDLRWNADLARTLCDYAHERWAAGRSVSPELWRGVGRFADGAALGDLERVLRTGSPRERCAAALALQDSSLPDAAALLETLPDLAADCHAGRCDWSFVAAQEPLAA